MRWLKNLKTEYGTINKVKGNINMWIVFNKQDSWTQGYSVVSEAEAIEICEEDTEMTYCYVDQIAI